MKTPEIREYIQEEYNIRDEATLEEITSKVKELIKNGYSKENALEGAVLQHQMLNELALAREMLI